MEIRSDFSFKSEEGSGEEIHVELQDTPCECESTEICLEQDCEGGGDSPNHSEDFSSKSINKTHSPATPLLEIYRRCVII